MYLLVFLSLKFDIYRCIYEIFCAIWYHLYNLENGGGVFRLLKHTNGNNCAKHHIYLFLWCLARFQDRDKIEVGSSNAFFLHDFFTIIIFFSNYLNSNISYLKPLGPGLYISFHGTYRRNSDFNFF